MAYKPHRLQPNYPGPEVATTKSPPVVVECWCLMVERMNRVRLDKFTRKTWRKFDAKDLEPPQKGDPQTATRPSGSYPPVGGLEPGLNDRVVVPE